MKIEPTLCYKAVQSRDPRFDGRFFTAVLTTGVYCRPVCPAVTPRPENVRFYPSAAAAQEAGFRPCLRCRPEASPGTPEWQETTSLVTRGLRLISEGVLDKAGVDGLAGSLNIGARHLRRLFARNLGAPPVAVAQTRRLDFARRLIDETSLPVTEIAFSAGFSSLRRFNDAFLRTYGRPPSAMRRLRASTADIPNFSSLGLKLYYRPPFDWFSLSRFLRDRAIPGVELVGEGYYRRTVRVREAVGVIEIRPVLAERHVLLLVSAQFSKDLLIITDRVRDLLDLRSDPLTIGAHLSSDPWLSPLVLANPGLRVPGAWDGFEIAVRAILGQQVSVKAASTMAGRLVQAFGEQLPQPGETGLTSLFPSPDRLCEADLTEIGMTRQRAKSIRELARAVNDGELSFTTSSSLEGAIERLAALPGIGAWTAHYIAMRALREPDAFPAGDLGLRRAISADGKSAWSEKDLIERSQTWRPWRAYAAMHLWNRYGALHAK